MTARERLERIERELRESQEAMTAAGKVYSGLVVAAAAERLRWVLNDCGTELEKVEVPGDG